MANALIGPYLGFVVLLAIAGIAKLRRPAAVVRALARTLLPIGLWRARLLGMAELAVALAAILLAGPATAGLVAGMYVLFSGYIALLRGGASGDNAGSCGCFGETDSPIVVPLHLSLTSVAALTATLMTVGGGFSARSVVWPIQVASAAMLALVSIFAWLAYVSLSLLPQTLSSAK